MVLSDMPLLNLGPCIALVLVVMLQEALAMSGVLYLKLFLMSTITLHQNIHKPDISSVTFEQLATMS